MHRRTRLGILALASSAALIAGCGSSSGGSTPTAATGTNDPSQSASAELTSAVDALGNFSTLTATLRLQASGSDISALAAEGGSTLTSTQANAIAGAQISLVVSAPSGKTLSDLTNGDTSGASGELTVSDNGTNLVSLRVVNKTIYLQADVKDLLNAFGKGETYAQLQTLSGQLPSFVQALLAGKWISLPESEASGLSSLVGPTTTTSPSPQQELALVNALKSVLTKDVTVTRTSSGTTDQLALTANSRTVAQDLLSNVGTTLPNAGTIPTPDPTQVPSKNVSLSAQVTGGALSQVKIDVGQFDPKGQAHLPVQLDLSQGGSAVAVPSGAVAVTSGELAELFALSGGLTGAGIGGI
jgi:hypothetical protein